MVKKIIIYYKIFNKKLKLLIQKIKILIKLIKNMKNHLMKNNYKFMINKENKKILKIKFILNKLKLINKLIFILIIKNFVKN